MLELLGHIVTDCVDWFSVLLLASMMIGVWKPLRHSIYPFLIAFLAAYVIVPFIPNDALPNTLAELSGIPNQIVFLVLFFILFYGIKIHGLVPYIEKGYFIFFSFLLVGWLAIRCAFWLFIYFQASFDSPFIRFHLDGPVTAVKKAQVWGFAGLQSEIVEHHTFTPKTLHTETRFTDKQIATMVNGLDEAEAFRLSLIQNNPSGKTQAQVLAQAIIQFQQSTNISLQDHVSLDGFILDEIELINSISGNAGEMFGTLSFELFNGKWYGKWDQYKVDHDWEPTLEFHPPIIIDTTNAFSLRAVQYAWIGDGFGWNAVIAPKHRNTGDVILGSVYHVHNQNPDEIYAHRPHVGISLDEGQLIWITQREIFLEQVIPSPNQNNESYSITGFFYEISNGKLINSGDGFQAVYTRNPDNRPDWLRFPVEISIDI